jgi:glucose-6-phosphate 1-dehydrogenase
VKTLSRPPNQDIIMIGATGDLARKKLLPALYSLSLQGLLPEAGAVVGYARTPLDDEGFRALATEAVRDAFPAQVDDAALDCFTARLRFVPARGGFDGLKALCGQKNRLIYLAIPPSAFASTEKAIGDADLM